MKALVTGGTGFLGSALCRELLNGGYHVRVLDSGWRERVAEDLIAEGVEVLAGDVRDASTVRKACEGCEVLWHLAYINGTRFFYEKPGEVLEVAIKGAVNTIDAATDAGVQRYILASSSEVYQEPEHIPTDESARLVVPDIKNPRYSYGGGKIASELLTMHYAKGKGLAGVIFRPHNFYGPNMGFEHVIPEVVRKIVTGSDGLQHAICGVPIQGDGRQTRAFCYIDDGVHGAVLAGEKGQPGEIYHVGTKEEVNIQELVAIIAQILGVSVEVIQEAEPPGATRRRCPDVSKLESLGYQAKISLREGLAKTVAWYAEYYLRQIGRSRANG